MNHCGYTMPYLSKCELPVPEADTMAIRLHRHLLHNPLTFNSSTKISLCGIMQIRPYPYNITLHAKTSYEDPPSIQDLAIHVRTSLSSPRFLCFRMATKNQAHYW